MTGKCLPCKKYNQNSRVNFEKYQNYNDHNDSKNNYTRNAGFCSKTVPYPEAVDDNVIIYDHNLQSCINYPYIHGGELFPMKLSHQRFINQVAHRPYLGNYEGAGMMSTDPDVVNIETGLIQGVSTNLKNGVCGPPRGMSTARFDCLPEFGNPQRNIHIIPPAIQDGGWIRGGANTRDYVRRIDYYRRCSLCKNY